MTQLPQNIAEKLNQLIPRDAIISYEGHSGWSYRKPSDAFTSSDSRNEPINQVTSENNQQIDSLLKTLGPLGKLDSSIITFLGNN